MHYAVKNDDDIGYLGLYSRPAINLKLPSCRLTVGIFYCNPVNCDQINIEVESHMPCDIYLPTATCHNNRLLLLPQPLLLLQLLTVASATNDKGYVLHTCIWPWVRDYMSDMSASETIWYTGPPLTSTARMVVGVVHIPPGPHYYTKCNTDHSWWTQYTNHDIATWWSLDKDLSHSKPGTDIHIIHTNSYRTGHQMAGLRINPQDTFLAVDHDGGLRRQRNQLLWWHIHGSCTDAVTCRRRRNNISTTPWNWRRFRNTAGCIVVLQSKQKKLQLQYTHYNYDVPVQ